MSRRERPLLALQVALALGAGTVLALSACFRPETLPSVEICTFSRLTGLPCPGCGLTRAFCAITGGDFAAAWRFNPFSYLFYAGCLALLGWPLLSLWRPRLETAVLRSPWFSRALLLLLGAMWLFGLGRILGLLLARAGG